MTGNSSIMMVTYNRLELTKRTISNIFATTKGPYQLMIVDNGSTDGTQEWLNDLVEKCNIYIHLHLNPENKGIAVGRNQGLLLSKKYAPEAEYMATIDNDVELPDDWLRNCTEIIDSNKKLAVGVNFEGTNYPVVTRNGKTYQWKSMGNLGTACSVFHKSLHEQIGFFTTEYGLYGEEDADFYFRARMVGWDMAYLVVNGIHLGEGALDVGPYREFKTLCHKNNLTPFQKNCMAYTGRTKSHFISFQDSSI